MAEGTLIDFYPTPEDLIEKLVSELKWGKINSILEPSAGKGDICDYVEKRFNEHNYHEADLDVIEINADLQHILRGKEYRLIHDDFLSFQTRKAYDLIIGNFPFSEGDQHLEKALDLLAQSGGRLRCLVNAETLRKTHTNLRKSLVGRLETLGAEIEYLTGEFESAEHRTSVEVALIKVKVDRPKPISIILESMEAAQDSQAEEYETAAVVETDFIKAICAHFNKECDAGIRLIDEYYAMKPFIKERLHRSGQEDYSGPLLKLTVEGRGTGTGSGIKADINNFLRGARKKYWEALICDPRFTNQYTSNILNQLDERLGELKDYDFTPFNIKALQQEMSAKIVAGVEAAILELFDTCSRVHAYGEDFGGNIWYYNGWKTNKAHKINKKIILPMYGLSAQWNDKPRIEYGFADKLNDMVKVFNYLSRDKVDVPALVGNVVAEADKYHDFKLDLRYFDIKLFKKGTAHIWFNHLELLEKFNIFGSQRKGWLPPAYGKKRYAEMTEEERQVVDDFQGREAYEKVMSDLDYYLVDAKTLLLTE